MFGPNNTRGREYYKNGRRISDAEALDPVNGVMKDGVTCRVPSYFRDAADTRPRLHDGYGGRNFNRPGWRVSDASIQDARETARQEYIARMADEYKNVKPMLTDANIDRGDWDYEPFEPHFFDNMTVDEIRRAHAEKMAEIYRMRDEELCNAWRNK